MTERFLKVEGHSDLVRDTNSHAIINHNNSAYNTYFYIFYFFILSTFLFSAFRYDKIN